MTNLREEFHLGDFAGLLYQGTPVFGCLPAASTSVSRLLVLRAELRGAWLASLPEQGAFLITTPSTPALILPVIITFFFSLCARSLQLVVQQGFLAKSGMLGVASYNLITAATGATLGSVEATPKIWDAGAWVIVQASGGAYAASPVFPLSPGQDYSSRSYPTLVVSRPELVPVFEPLVRSLAI